MQALRGLAILLLLQTAGEALVSALSLPFPGPVVGMILLLLSLNFARVREPIAACAQILLQHLSLLFVPVGVGVVAHLDLLSEHGGLLAIVIALSTWIGLAVTAVVLNLLLKQEAPTEEGPVSRD
jgi:holin-like protein